MRIALMGSVSSSLHALNALVNDGVDVAGVLGLPPEAGLRVADYRDLGVFATERGLPYLPFNHVGEPTVEEFLRRCAPDQLWVVGLSQMVPEALIRIAPRGGIGFHPTMLPEGRGRAPVAWTIIRAARAGATFFQLTAEVDAGDIVAQREVPVGDDDYASDVLAKIDGAIEDCVADIAPALRAGRLDATPQDHSRATYYPRRRAEDGWLDWSSSMADVYRFVRAVGRPYPGAFSYVGGIKVTVWRGRPMPGAGPRGQAPGTILTANATAGLDVVTGDGLFRVSDFESDAGLPRFEAALREGARSFSSENRAS